MKSHTPYLWMTRLHGWPFLLLLFQRLVHAEGEVNHEVVDEILAVLVLDPLHLKKRHFKVSVIDFKITEIKELKTYLGGQNNCSLPRFGQDLCQQSPYIAAAGAKLPRRLTTWTVLLTTERFLHGDKTSLSSRSRKRRGWESNFTGQLRWNWKFMVSRYTVLIRQQTWQVGRELWGTDFYPAVQQERHKSLYECFQSVRVT